MKKRIIPEEMDDEMREIIMKDLLNKLKYACKTSKLKLEYQRNVIEILFKEIDKEWRDSLFEPFNINIDMSQGFKKSFKN